MTALERPGAAGEGARSEPRPLHQIFPLSDEARSGQMQRTWAAFCREMDQAVRAALDGSRSPPEIAYAVGDLLHNYFRTRGVTLTSYELRRLVVELLALHAPVPPSDELSTMVSFAAPGAGQSDWTGDEPPPAQPPVAPPAVAVAPAPSRLVTRVERHDAAFDRLLLRVVEAARPAIAGLARPVALEAIGRVVDDVVQGEPGEWPAAMRERFSLVALSEICGLGLIDRLWADRSIRAVFINGPKAVYVERDGAVEPADEAFRDEAHLDELLSRLTHGAKAGVIDVRLRDGGAGTVIFPPAAPGGPVLAIRRGDPGEATFERLIASELLDSRAADLLRIAARSRLSIMVAGPRGSGKTALLAAIARDLEGMRVVTVAPHRAFRWPSLTKVELVAEPAGLRSLIDAAVRLRPDLLVLDSVASRDLPNGRRGVIAGVDADLAAGSADLVVKLGRATDGLFRVLALQDANGADVLPGPAVAPAFSEAVRAAGYGEALERLVGQH
jgi:type IV secretory pathway ATPase VirB11/archaellum biosynthesis ATPase